MVGWCKWTASRLSLRSGLHSRLSTAYRPVGGVDFRSLPSGYSQGQGQLKPQNIVEKEKRALIIEILDNFMGDPCPWLPELRQR